MENIDSGEHGKRWFAAETYSKMEYVAARHFHDSGFSHFLPCYRKKVRHSRRETISKAAFFPRYLFVAFDPVRDRWLRINRTIGVRSLVMQGERPLPVPHGVVEELQSMTDAEGYLRLGTDLVVGDKVRVMDGPFVEMMGRIERLDGKHRVQILIEMMNGRIPVNMSRESIAKAAKARK